jgi:hypothetical protein
MAEDEVAVLPLLTVAVEDWAGLPVLEVVSGEQSHGESVPDGVATVVSNPGLAPGAPINPGFEGIDGCAVVDAVL